jgi:ribosomal-protein-alanine N-acetyltransferase
MREPTPTDAHRPGTAIAPASVAELEAVLVGPDTFTERFGRRVEPGWSSFDGVLEVSLRSITTGGWEPEWATHFIYDEADGALIGIGGFKGPPDEGAVEIGYEIAPAFRGQGRACAAARQLVDRARAAGCALVTAHTLAERNPSTSVLAKLGFVRTQEIDDPDDGPIWRWELPIN